MKPVNLFAGSAPLQWRSWSCDKRCATGVARSWALTLGLTLGIDL